MPYRRIRHWKIIAVSILCGVLILGALGGAAIAVVGRANELNEFIYNQCVRDQNQDLIIIEQLKAAKRRIPPTIEPGSIAYQMIVTPLNDGIAALESDPPCNPPEEDEP